MSDESKTSVPLSPERKAATTALTRRQFLTLAGAASAAALLAACSPSGGGSTPAPATGSTPAAPAATTAPQVATGGGELSYLHWTNFVPDMDTKLDELCKTWGDKNKVKVTVEHININDIPTRRAAAVQAKAGPDLIWDTQNWPVLFKDSLADVSDLVDELGKTLGGWYPFTEQFAKVEGKWRALPHGIGPGTFVYRTDWFKQNSVSAPKTWDDFMKMAATLKKFGKPVGQALGHSFGDPPGFWYPWLWSWGGKEVETDGKTVALDSPETLLSLEKAVELYKSGLLEAGIAWDDSSNNRSYLAEEISCTANGASIYFVARQNAEKGDALAKKVYENSDHFAYPAGPKGAFTLAGQYSTGIMSYSKNIPAAKDLLRWLMQPEQYMAWMDSGKGYLQGLAKNLEGQAIFKTDPKMKPFQDNLLGDTAKWLGWPGPLSAAAYRVYNNQTIVDMYAKACVGEFTPKAAAAWAETTLKGVYK